MDVVAFFMKQKVNCENGLQIFCQFETGRIKDYTKGLVTTMKSGISLLIKASAQQKKKKKSSCLFDKRRKKTNTQ